MNRLVTNLGVAATLTAVIWILTGPTLISMVFAAILTLTLAVGVAVGADTASGRTWCRLETVPFALAAGVACLVGFVLGGREVGAAWAVGPIAGIALGFFAPRLGRHRQSPGTEQA